MAGKSLYLSKIMEVVSQLPPVSWSSVGGAARYELRQKRGNGSWILVYNSGGISKSFTNKSNGSYNYRVRGCNETCGPVSNTRTVVVDIPPPTNPPTTPTNFTFLVNSGVVYWDAVNDAEFYQLEVYSGGWTPYYEGPSTGMTTGGYTNFRVRACNDLGCSPWNSYPNHVY